MRTMCKSNSMALQNSKFSYKDNTFDLVLYVQKCCLTERGSYRRSLVFISELF